MYQMSVFPQPILNLLYLHFVSILSIVGFVSRLHLLLTAQIILQTSLMYHTNYQPQLEKPEMAKRTQSHHHRCSPGATMTLNINTWINSTVLSTTVSIDDLKAILLGTWRDILLTMFTDELNTKSWLGAHFIRGWGRKYGVSRGPHSAIDWIT